MRRFVRLALLLLCASLLATTSMLAATAPGSATGSLGGAVTDPSGARVVKATVIVQGENGTVSSVQTSADGTYALPQLAPGVYVISITAPGLALAEAQSVTVEAGRTTTHNLALIISVEQQQVTVSEQGGVVSEPS